MAILGAKFAQRREELAKSPKRSRLMMTEAGNIISMSRFLEELHTQCHPKHVKNPRASTVWIKSGTTSCARLTNAHPRNQFCRALFVPIVRCNLMTTPSGNMSKRHIQIDSRQEEIQRKPRSSRRRLEPWLSPQSFPGIDPGISPFFHSKFDLHFL